MSKKIIITLIIILGLAVAVLLFIKRKQGTLLPQVLPAKEPLQPTGNTVAAAVVDKTNFPLSEGSKGKAVMLLQIYTGVTVDGIWGEKTTKAILNYLGAKTISEADFYSELISPAFATDKFPLKMGSNNNYVKAVQALLGLSVDGIWGKDTEAAVTKYTGKNTLTAGDFNAMAISMLGLTQGSVMPIDSFRPDFPTIPDVQYA